MSRAHCSNKKMLLHLSRKKPRSFCAYFLRTAFVNDLLVGLTSVSQIFCEFKNKFYFDPLKMQAKLKQNIWCKAIPFAARKIQHQILCKVLCRLSILLIKNAILDNISDCVGKCSQYYWRNDQELTRGSKIDGASRILEQFWYSWSFHQLSWHLATVSLPYRVRWYSYILLIRHLLVSIQNEWKVRYEARGRKMQTKT